MTHRWKKPKATWQKPRPLAPWKRPKPRIVLCIGVTDEVFDMQGNHLGYVGFHEYDYGTKMLNMQYLRNKLYWLAKEMDTQIICLRTTYGYHFLSLEIWSEKERDEVWGKTMAEAFPSDYIQFPYKWKKGFHRILRISNKGEQMKPKIISAYTRLINQHRQLSSAHIEIYVDQGIIPYILFEDREEDFVETITMAPVLYMTRGHVDAIVKILDMKRAREVEDL